MKAIQVAKKLVGDERQNEIYSWLFDEPGIHSRYVYPKDYPAMKKQLDMAKEDYKKEAGETSNQNELYLAARVALMAGESKEKLKIEKMEGCILVKGDGQSLKMNISGDIKNKIHARLEEVSAFIHRYNNSERIVKGCRSFR